MIKNNDSEIDKEAELEIIRAINIYGTNAKRMYLVHQSVHSGKLTYSNFLKTFYHMINKKLIYEEDGYVYLNKDEK